MTSFLGRNIAQLGIHLFRRVSDTERERVTDHPVIRTLSHPGIDVTRYEFVDALVQDLAIYDNAYLLKVARTDGGVGLVRLPPLKVEVLADSWLQPDGYRLTGNRGHVDYPADAVIHFRGYNPTDPRVGSSPLESLRRILAEEAGAAEYREQLWRSGARVSSAIYRPAAAPPWSDKARDRFITEWRDLYTGQGVQAGGSPLLEDGMTLEKLGFSAEQAQYIEARKLTREEVTAAYHIPLPMVGLLEHATFSNIQEQHKQLYQDTLGPWLQMLTQRLELRLFPDFAGTDDLYLEFNLAEKLRGSFEEQAAQLQTAVGAPWLLRSEARARMNLPFIDGTDELVTPLNVLIGDQASPTDSAPPPPVPTGASARHGLATKARVVATDGQRKSYEAVLTRHFERQRKAVLSKLGAKAATAVDLDTIFDRARWDRELAADLFGVNRALALATARQVLVDAGVDPSAVSDEGMGEWLAANATAVAEGVNQVTADGLSSALEDDDPSSAVAHVFEVALAARALQVATTETTGLAGFAGREGARVGGLTHKTWHTTSAKPRSSHARMSGQTVPIDGLFSNGARWPGDHVLSADERGGCRCEVSFVTAP